MDAEVHLLTADHLEAAVDVLARGMRDNPAHVAVFGDDPGYRVEALTRMFAGLMPTQSQPLHAVRDGETVGVCGLAPPGECLGDLFRAMDGEIPPISDDPGEQGRIAEWLGAWAERDPADRHWHLGPIAADLHLQGQGIGSLMMEEFCRRVDEAGDVAYLETDKDENVSFYMRFRFTLVGAATVLGTHNWFMQREPV